MDIHLKRAYAPAESGDGFRILVDRLWPRGISKEEAKVDLWLKEIAPSNELRKWYNHEPDKWPEFQKRYIAELAEKRDAVQELLGAIKRGRVTLLYASKEAERNNAVALKAYIGGMQK